MDFDQLWKTALAQMEIQLSRANFATWLKNSRLVDKKDGVFSIALPNNFSKEWVENKYQKNLLGIIRSIDASAKKLDFVVDGNLEHPLKSKNPSSQKESAEKAGYQTNLDLRTDPNTNLNSRYTLNSFVVGPSNELAYAAATAIVKDVGKKYNPLFIYGGVGLGKTHLIQAIGNEIKSVYGGKVRPYYVTSERFVNDVVWSIKNKRMEDMKKKYRDVVDVLIVDDIQFIGGKEKTEEEFFHTFNALYENSKQIIISSDRPPQAIPTLEERLRSRFEGGLITDISYPEYETRVAIINEKLTALGKHLPPETVDLVAKKVKKNIRELEGILTKIIFYQDRKGENISVKAAADIIEKSLQTHAHHVSDNHILKAVAEFYRISEESLLSSSRRKEAVEPRQVAMYLLRDILELSYPYIGEKLGRDHTTAIHSYEKINHEINKNSTLNQKVLLIKDAIFKG